MAVINNLKEIRESRGLLQEDLSLIHISEPTRH